jgi:branched-chain amino acid transport system substrate-binding protein
VLALGQDVCTGLVLTNSFYWAQTPQTEAWTARYVAKMNKPPTEYNAASYAAVYHWMKAAKAANTVDADAVATKMRELPVDDFYNSGVKIQDNGCVPHAMYLWEVKPEEANAKKWDVYKHLSTLPSPEAYPPPALFGCPLVRS